MTNSASFGEEGQENLIFPEEINGSIEDRNKYHRVTAVVVKQSRFGNKRPQSSEQVILEAVLGYINRETLDSIYKNAK